MINHVRSNDLEDSEFWTWWHGHHFLHDCVDIESLVESGLNFGQEREETVMIIVLLGPSWDPLPCVDFLSTWAAVFWNLPLWMRGNLWKTRQQRSLALEKLMTFRQSLGSIKSDIHMDASLQNWIDYIWIYLFGNAVMHFGSCWWFSVWWQLGAVLVA